MTGKTQLCDLALIGLGVMGKNLALNLADNGYKVAGLDVDSAKVRSIIEQDKTERKQPEPRIFGCLSYTELLASLSSPHFILLSVPAGEIVDAVCAELVAAGLDKDAIVIDTGNSLWTDSVEREARFKGQFNFFSMAVSGGEVGARFGPSLMPSGDRQAWARVEPVVQAIAAKVDAKTGKPIESMRIGEPVKHGEPCVTYIGPAGSGHYVKMVHNGIEYADMQLICEAYQIMRDGLDMQPSQIAAVFRHWNRGKLNSYLIEISAEVLEQVDAETQKPLVDLILDKAGQKGTGLWTAVSALQIGSPAQTITQAVFARSLSSLKDERVKASNILKGPDIAPVSEKDKDAVIDGLYDALYCAKICAYAQGFQLMHAASQEQGWQLDFAAIARIWRAGCIIRAMFLQPIADAFEENPELPNLLIAPYFSDQIHAAQHNWRTTIAQATMMGIPCSALSSALNYYDSYRCAVLPANLLQGQRDYFGAHTYQRIDKPAGEKYHTEWSLAGRPEVKI